MRTKIFSFLIITVIFSAGILAADDITIGGDSGWNGIRMINTGLVSLSGMSAVQLADSEYEPTPDTELLMHFNRGLADARGLYTVKQDRGIQISPSYKKKGAGSAVFTGDGRFIELIPDDSAIFAAGSGRLNDFSIEFWLNPARLSEGEHVIQWTGAVAAAEATLQQEILCGISGRNIFWDFSNIFLTPELKGTRFTLYSSRSLIPKRWHHHMIRYDNTTGLLEYLIDGIPEDIVYTSAEGTEQLEIWAPTIGAAKPSRFIIGRGYTGFIDELRITGAFSRPDLNRYSINSGTAVSDIIDLNYYDSRFYRLDADFKAEGKTQIYYYYRISNKYFLPGAEYPMWNQFEPGSMLAPDIQGRYLQIMCELFPDGTGQNTPVLSGMTIRYEKNLPPLPPAYVSASPGSSKAVIKWNPVTEHDIAGYRVYYGTQPGLYFGTEASEGKSPIDAGNSTSLEINGLDNGKLYYFAVTSYDNAEVPHESIFSREISTRPSALIRE